MSFLFNVLHIANLVGTRLATSKANPAPRSGERERRDEMAQRLVQHKGPIVWVSDPVQAALPNVQSRTCIVRCTCNKGTFTCEEYTRANALPRS